MNELTKKLLTEGYTKDYHPDYVNWYGNMHEFEYTQEFTYNSIWEAPCGVMRKGEFTHGYSCYNGVEWRPENNNYNFHCPHRKKECKFFHPLLKELPLGSKCSWHLSDKPYDYNNSAEKIEDERNNLIRENLNKKFGTNGMISCTCCHIDEDTCKPYFKYDPYNCINYRNSGCWHETCLCTGKGRDLTLANIYYDIKTITEYQCGFIVEPVIQIKKGIKLFDSRKSITDLEMFLKAYPNEIYDKEKMRHSKQLFFAKYNGKKFELEVINIRIEKRESRDLIQDLQNIREGIQVFHESDIKKEEKESKRKRRKAYKEAKERKKSKQKKNDINVIEQLTIF